MNALTLFCLLLGLTAMALAAVPYFQRFAIGRGVHEPCGLQLRGAGAISPNLVEVFAERLEGALRTNMKLQQQFAKTKVRLQHWQVVAKRAVHQAHTDPLTGIPNRLGLARILESARRQTGSNGQPDLYVLVADVDHFKRLNDCFGHAVGDEALQVIAATLEATVPNGSVARHGGEEFTLVVQANSEQELAQVADDLLRAVHRARLVRCQKDYSISISIGAARWNRQESPETALERADRALYKAKESGRNLAYFHNGEQLERLSYTETITPQGSQFSAKESGAERRLAIRYPLLLIEKVAFCENSVSAEMAFEQVSCVDISQSGLSFVMDSRPPHRTLSVNLSGLRKPLLLSSEVVRSTELHNGRWHVACRFVNSTIAASSLTPVPPILADGQE